MADNITTQSSTLATVPASTVIATDDSGGAHYQIVELADATTPTQRLAIDSGGRIVVKISDGTDTLAVNADGSINIAGTVTASSATYTRTQVTPTVSTTPAYTVKDAVGGVMTFSSVAATSGGTIRVVQCQVVDKAQQMKDYDLVLFDRSITASTDNAVFDPTDTELGYVVGVIPIGGWSDFNDNSVFDAPVDIVADLNGTALYGQLVSRSVTGPTFVSTSDIVVTLTTGDLTG